MKKVIHDTNAEYHSQTDYIGSSGLKVIFKKSVYHYLNMPKLEPTDSMRLGTAVHTALLEPEKFDDEVIVLPELNLRTKAGREERDAIMEKAERGQVVIKEDDLKVIQAIERNFKNDRLALAICEGGVVEASHYGVIEGIKVRCRPDVYQPDRGIIGDVKTCQDNSPRAFKSDVYKYGYHLQAVFYAETLTHVLGKKFSPFDFRFIAVETKYPFSCEVYALDEREIENGYDALNKAWAEWKVFKETGVVLGYQTQDTASDGALIL